MQVCCHAAYYFRPFAKVTRKSHPAKAPGDPIQKKRCTRACLHAANACSYVLNVWLYMRSDALWRGGYELNGWQMSDVPVRFGRYKMDYGMNKLCFKQTSCFI